MSALEILAIVVFFLIGYWIVEYFWPKPKRAAPVTVRVARQLAAPPEGVFDAWLDPHSAGKWLFATPAGEMVRVEIDARLGGSFIFVDRRDGEDIEHTGDYLAIDRPHRLAFTFVVPKFSMEASRVTIDIVRTDDGSELTLAHEGVLPEYASRTEEGWNSILDGLAGILAAPSGVLPKP